MPAAPGEQHLLSRRNTQERPTASLVRGQNTPLTSPQLTVTVSGVTPGSVDLMVFQVTATGNVRNDSDFVFFTRPVSPEGAVRLAGPSTVAVDVTKVPHGIDRLRLAVSMDDSAPGSSPPSPASA